MDRELLLEIGVEELPAAWLPGLTKQLAEKLHARLKEMRLTPDVQVESFSTPRRLTARVGRMPERQEDLDETISGPPVSAAFTASGEPTPAALGFAKKQGVAFESLERLETPKGTYLALKKHHRGKSTVDALPELLGLVLRDLTFPKQMHWDAVLEDGKGEFVFGRPIRWLLYLYGGRVVPFTIARTPNAVGPQVQEITTGAVTYGHRFLATSGRAGRSIKVRTFDEYRARLPEHFVILEHSVRRDRIARELETKARKLGGRVHLREQAALLDEVADLVEFPGVVAGFFDRAFLQLPQEVLTTTLVHHQHYFPVLTENGELKEAFLAVVNTQPTDERLIAKNAERVVTARLRDAKFFWQADRKIKLEDRLDRLHTIVFHKKIGSYRDKAERIEKLARTIVTDVFEAAEHADHAAKAARWAKADLASDMVFEFPELQGQMGGIYAREEGHPEQVWKAIYFQYLPVGLEYDAPPSIGQLGSAAIPWGAVSLADKLDTVVGLFAVGEKPTGSRDPFGIRRAAQGIVKILADLQDLGLKGPLQASVPDLLAAAYAQLPDAVQTTRDGWRALGLSTFFAEREAHLFERRGFKTGEVRSVTGHVDDPEYPQYWQHPHLAMSRIKAVADPSLSMDLKALAGLLKRAANISKGVRFEAGWSALADYSKQPDVPDAERQLISFVAPHATVVHDARMNADYAGAARQIAQLQPYVAKYFDDVMVMTDDLKIRGIRLQIMAGVRDLVLNLADISEIASDDVRQA